MKVDLAVAMLAALAQETRLAVFRLLVQAGEGGLAAGAIGERLGLPPATLSFHLKALAQAGLVKARSESRFVIYTASYREMGRLIDYLTEHCCAGDASRCAPRRTC